MRNTATNTLQYTGIVTLSQYIGTKKVAIAQVNNSGAYSLFDFFADCLVGDFTIANFGKPAKIMLLQKEDDETFYSRSSFIYGKAEKVSSLSAGSEKSSTVRFSFIIPRDRVETVKFNHIGLYSASARDFEPENFLASVDLGEELFEQTQSVSTALVLDWELRIINSDKD